MHMNDVWKFRESLQRAKLYLTPHICLPVINAQLWFPNLLAEILPTLLPQTQSSIYRCFLFTMSMTLLSSKAIIPPKLPQLIQRHRHRPRLLCILEESPHGTPHFVPTIQRALLDLYSYRRRGTKQRTRISHIGCRHS